jgi:cytochrome b6-f complex iron-sulfur subunit
MISQEESPMVKPVEMLPLHSRREFCAQACQAASVLALGTIAGCGDGSTSPSSTSAPPLASAAATVAGRVVSVTVAGSALATAGSAATVQTSLGTFLVSRSATDTFVALTAICTHEQCTITGFDGSRYVCPCHGSQYNTSGSVVMGPASRALQQFPTAFASGVLTFTA